jgi:RNA polymerase sigma-70 factor (TIGR02960 family)
VTAIREDQLLERARGGDEQAFRDLTAPLRPGVQLHCYRMLGSIHDADDIAQETLLRAWRALDRFGGRSSFATWLYRIATNACLDALRAGSRRRQLEPPPEPPGAPPEPTRTHEPYWLDPYPDSLLDGVADRGQEPDVRYDLRESVELAFLAALQCLPARQRAALLLRDVLGFSAREAAEMLDTTEGAVHAALLRARAAVERRAPHERAPAPATREERDLVGRFADAFQSGDVQAVVALLTTDASLTMPPEPLEYVGPEAIARFFERVPAGGQLQRFRLVPTRANGSPAFGCYLRDPRAPLARAYGLMVLTIEGDRIAAITGFPDTSVFGWFGLPRTLDD